MKLQLGRKVQCQVTKFKGIVIAETTYLNKCHQFLIEPGLNKDGEMKKCEWIDAVQLKVIGQGVTLTESEKEEVKRAPAGGIRNHSTR